MAWDYQREEKHFDAIPEGKYRVRVKSVEKAVSSKGNDMITIQLDVSGFSKKIFHYITFLPDNPKLTNAKLTEFYDSFKDIPEGSKDLNSWVGKVGACCIKHEDYNDQTRERVSYFIEASKQDSLPPWVEKADEFITVPASEVSDDIPFI